MSMTVNSERLARCAALASVVGAALLIGAGTAAADEWPSDNGGALSVYETKDFAVPSDPDYWNPFSDRHRLSSPFGTSTRIVCTSFHGVQQDCWQADLDGNPHKLNKAPLDVPWAGSAQTGRFGPNHDVYPG
ncbi:hypothetical protein ACIA8C_07790 [Nocardia sp. NPDC051321]|uniref:hypothetical protein n=1 Tax=Nocardia sp. NPDC051321 TaxID=3364323 RepID=UPI0037BB6AA0